MKDDLEENSGGEKRKFGENEDTVQSAKKKKWKNRGVNKHRPLFKVDAKTQLCPRLIDRQTETDATCDLQRCKFAHELSQYLASKLPNLGGECYVYNTTGHCLRGITCRYSSKHVTEDGLNIVNKNLYEKWKSDTALQTRNTLSFEVLQQLRKRTYRFDKADKVLAQWGTDKKNKVPVNGPTLEEKKGNQTVDCDDVLSVVNDKPNKNINVDISADCESGSVLNNGFEVETKVNCRSSEIGPIIDYEQIKLRNQEKRKIDWRDKLFLSPLTTVGNLPFRRVVKQFGADVTCGEMALAVNLLQGKQQEWALTKRHGSEDLFGVQVCGNNPNVMTKCAQLVQEQADVDFIDINVGCPIDLIYQQGAGSGLLSRKKVLLSMVKCMKSILDVPLTLKTRIGVYSGKNVAHTIMEELTNAGTDLITIHGRTKEQRYTKLADWEYIEQCAQLASPTPVVGNGDILSYEDYDMAREKCPSAASVMIGRGALIKPWIFTELKERRHWDISSRERLNMLRDFSNFGLEHWGSDTKGVENTRRFLLEWLSFLYRYVPVGLLEKPPQKMNERPPKLQGRDDLEELMASANCADWIKISEMLLGPVPDGFQFLPKHKANAWS